MNWITLTNGGTALVDDKRWLELMKHNWQLSPQGYAHRCTKHKTILMHRAVIGAKAGEIVDHINQDRLDNRRANLRLVSNQANSLNTKMNKRNTSGYRNVTFRKDTRKWQAGAMRDRKFISLGSYATVELAHTAVQSFLATEGRE